MMPLRGLISNNIILIILATVVLTLNIGIVYSQLSSKASEGLDYFVGNKPFANGGPPCVSCHRISSLEVSGGISGPDLSTVLIKGKFTEFRGDKNSLKEFLRNPNTPTMRGVWSVTPLTDDEIDSITELLSYAVNVGGMVDNNVSDDPPFLEWNTVYVILGIVAALIIIVLIYLRRR